MKILFVGETWLGSCARSMCEALRRHPTVQVDEFAVDRVVPAAQSLALRVAQRLLRPLYRRELYTQIIEKVRITRPDFVVFYKGGAVDISLLRTLKRMGTLTINIYPDYSPHAYGEAHQTSMGAYDLVCSTKPFHPDQWFTTYGYQNRCVFVPQGYDPALHLAHNPPSEFEFDVALIATYRPEYGDLLAEFARNLNATSLRVLIGGYGWGIAAQHLPSRWTFTGPVQGTGYINLLRSAKICIAPLNRKVSIGGKVQPGDVDTTRTYELAAAYCFFIHQRTDFAIELYDGTGLPMFNDGAELASHVKHFISKDADRLAIAHAVHQRAVPNFSLDSRAAQIIELLRNSLPVAE